MKRREFLRGTAAFGATLAANSSINSLTFAQTPGGRRKTIVKIFQRGGADGLHLVPPVFDDNYYRARSSVRVERHSGSDSSTALRLSNVRRSNPASREFGLNPNMVALQEIWEEGALAISPATAFDNAGRSHFSAQKRLEFASDNANLNEGFFSRYLQIVNPRLNTSQPDRMRAIRPGTNTMAPVFFGNVSVPIISDNQGGLQSEDFCSGSGCTDNQLTEMLRNIGSNDDTDNELENHVRRADVQVVNTLGTVLAATTHRTNAGGLEYSDSDIGRGLRLVSQLLKDGQPLEIASVNWAIGWDTHADHVALGDDITDDNMRLVRGIKDGSNDLLTFYRDMKNSGMLDDVVVIMGSEFGRTVEQNGSNGTDHGFGSTWFAFGGTTRGGIYKPFENLQEQNLAEGRYVPKMLDYKDIMAEAMSRHLGLSDSKLRSIFLGYNYVDQRMFG